MFTKANMQSLKVSYIYIYILKENLLVVSVFLSKMLAELQQISTCIAVPVLQLLENSNRIISRRTNIFFLAVELWDKNCLFEVSLSDFFVCMGAWEGLCN